MPEVIDIRDASERERLRRFAVIAGILVLMMPLTWLARSWNVRQVSESARPIQRQAVTSALDRIEREFEQMQSDLLDRARDVAREPAVVRGLRTRARHDLTEGPEEIVRHFTELDVPQHTSVELYDATPQLVAWNGFSMPLDDAPSSPRFLGAPQTSIATDAGVRRALVVWWPVREGTRVLGVVRVMRMIAFDAPVRNEYLRDISLSDRWRRMTELPVQVSFDPPPDPGGDGAAQVRLLEGVDGRPLGRVSIDPPPPGQLVEATAARYDDVLAFWLVLLMFWAVGGLWYVYHGMLEGLPDKPRGRVLWRVAGWFALVAALWWSIRFALLNLEVPARWQGGKAPLAPLFDPMHFASGFGGGLMRSTGDLLLTAIFFLVFAIAFLDLTRAFRERSAYLYQLRERLRRGHATATPSVFAAAGMVAVGTVAIQGLAILLAMATRHVVLDSTFDFFARKGLLPDPLLLLVFCALIVLTVGVLLVSVGIVWIAASAVLRRLPDEMSIWAFCLTIALAIVLPVAVLHTTLPVSPVISWPVSLSFIGVAFTLAVYLMMRERSIIEMFILRSILPSFFLVTVLLYPMLYNGMDASRRIEMLDAAMTFSEGRDPRVLFALEQLLREIRTNDAVRDVLREDDAASLDSLAETFFQRSFLSSLPAYDVTLSFYDADRRAVGRYYDTGRSLDRRSLSRLESLESTILYLMYEEGDGSVGVMVAPITGTRELDRLQYGGIAPVYAAGSLDVNGWVTVRAEPESVLREGGTPFPRVLLPSGSYDDLYTNVSIAEFRDGVLVRTMGRDFGRYRLPEDVRQALAAESSIWRSEVVEERAYQTYYQRYEHTIDRGDAAILPSTVTSIVGVRVPSINTFDHLYYLLRLTVAGLLIGLPLYLLGLYVRRRAGMLPAPRVRFRDKVLNAFLGVGIISVAAVGFVGLEVVTGENERSVQSWLRQHLERVEETLDLDTRDEQMPYTVLDRVSIDSLAARVGLDLNVYRGYSLAKLSRPQLVRERLIDQRLPIEAYHALFFDGYRFVYTDERVGDFVYTTGFRALPDEEGRPRFVVSVPTLPEQERIEEERARTVAYLFGSLLLLVLVVMLTASLLANAISRPIARLRSGLQAVAAGRFERMIPVDSRDEIGELVQTFNEMQEQLADSRRKLAQQERQLAWREMARQVAHEIKNPLTPMKLSVQHLQRAFRNDGTGDPEKGRDFASIFERITTTLIEQIDTLARIANEFHSFARMPSRILEKVDLNAIVDQAVSLMQEESDVEITMDLYPHPMIVDADREELRRIYINIVKNAIQAIPEDRRGRVDVRTAFEPPNTAMSSVTDNGTGVEADAQDRIFEPNFSTKTSGTGLGLAIAKKGVEEMGGEIGFETEEGEGTTVWIRLPIVEESDERPGV